MTDADPTDLIHLEDPGGDRCVVRVAGREPGLRDDHDMLRAAILVHADFVDARLELHLSPRDLDAWQAGLNGLRPGTGTSLGGERGAGLAVHLQEDRSLAVTVHDPDRLSVVLWIQPPENWTDEHLERLERVRRS
ncbi:DUF5959 family protein [Kitasatospora phosalacinea]|uniref:Uncharacterized protein n=1 Tax=Kitasatospora phosalacinea TaxID=2065 RepID=A0A9W6PC14_9ACTN|nr:DUF5959 family protein [Kitasatospora phosalacinea]GLW52223.1 hypothetical protein Kpho01_02340 [Kitasatospora phosalacinea]